MHLFSWGKPLASNRTTIRSCTSCYALDWLDMLVSFAVLYLAITPRIIRNTICSFDTKHQFRFQICRVVYIHVQVKAGHGKFNIKAHVNAAKRGILVKIPDNFERYSLFFWVTLLSKHFKDRMVYCNYFQTRAILVGLELCHSMVRLWWSAFGGGCVWHSQSWIWAVENYHYSSMSSCNSVLVQWLQIFID